ncbi:MAG TPA: response regulator [Thermoanaerobaculia bacterium]|nr:response regulator [Thermoanaerobaculia bacterium]
MKSQPGRRRWVAGALRAGRAAAFLTLATGINGTIAALEPRYEPIYVYLAAVVIVAWLGSMLLGVTTAVAAIILYDTMFSPIERSVSWSAALPFVVAIGAALFTRLARVPVQRARAFGPAVPPPLLETSPPKVVEIRPAFDADEIEDLREQLADAGRALDETRDQLEEARKQLEEARAQGEKETRMHVEQTATARSRLSGLQHELDAARADTIEQTRRAAALERDLEAARTKTREAEARINDTTQELEVAWRRVDEEKARSDKEAKRLLDLEQRANEALQKATSDLAARYQEPLAEAKKRLEEAFTRIPVLENERDAAMLSAGEASARAAALEQESARLRKALDGVRSNGELLEQSEVRRLTERAENLETKLREAQRQAEEARSKEEIERSQRERADGDFDRKLASIADGLTRDYEDSLGQALVEKEAARAEVRDLTARKQSAEKKLAEAKARIDEARSKEEIERSERERAEAGFDRKLAGIVDGLTRDYEDSIGQAMVEKEAARAEVRALKSKVEALQTKVELDRAQRESIEADLMPAARAEIGALTENLESLQKQLARAGEETSRLETDLEEVRSRAELERAAHERALGDFDRKISTIVSGITNDHEQAIGEAMLEKEAARAEVRSLNKRVETLQQKLDAERARADEEKAAREKLDAEWNEKLQTIVSHLASDHESDLGEAILEKQAAKAEVRELTTRMKTLEQRLATEQRRSVEMPLPSRAVVLIAHSDAGMRAMSKHALEQAGYTVMTAADGLEALRVASTQRPDAVLAEAVMPKMNGRELLQLLKARSETAGVKFVLMNGGDTGHGSDFRADDVLTTPADFAAMKAALAAVLAR